MLFKFGQHPSPGLFGDKFAVANNFGTVVSSVRGKTKTALANQVSYGDGAGNFSSGPGGATSGNPPGYDQMAGSGANQDRYNPVRDRLDEGSVVEDWIPRDASGLDTMFKLMYHRDHIAGTLVDLIAETIWSDFDLTGIQDPGILKVYQDTMELLDPLSICPELTREFLVLGRSIGSMIFDEKRGIFRDIITHDPSLVRITPIPLQGYDPKIDLFPSPGLRAFVNSSDPRDTDALRVLPEAFINAIKSASGGRDSSGGSFSKQSQLYGPHHSSSGASGIPLDPINTLFVARKVFGHDRIGTSLFTRLITFWALEKALINATVSSARRRSRSILHIKMGIDNIWEPSPAEMDNTAGMFIQADEDPVGAVVATRNGVDAQEIRQGQDFYKWSDEWQLLNEGKLRALGANDSLLSGESTYNNQDAARAFFMERAQSLRNILTSRIFYRRLFTLTARVHGFFKNPKSAQLDKVDLQDVPYSKKLTQREILEAPDSELIVPTITWRKELVNSIDEKRLEILDRLESKGVPISLKQWAAAANVDLDSMLSDLDRDADLRKQVAAYKASYENALSAEEQEAKLAFVNSLKKLSESTVRASLHESKQDASMLEGISSYIFWGPRAKIGNLTASALAAALNKLRLTDQSLKRLFNSRDLESFFASEFKDITAAKIAAYLLFRQGISPAIPELTTQAQDALAENINDCLLKHANETFSYQLGKIACSEIKQIRALSSAVTGPQPATAKVFDPIPTASVNLYGGIS
jgi:hypothetical protein